MGGLYDDMRLLAHFFIAPFGAFVLNSELLAAISRDISSSNKVLSMDINSKPE